VHRDLQPRNILVSESGQVKLSNFFLATEHQSALPPELLEGNSGFAEPNYMSPEQVLGEPPDPRSDLFSLGVLFYEMLSGTRPFAAPGQHSISQAIRHDPPAPLDPKLNIPPTVERLLLRALEKDPADRFADAGEFELGLRQALEQFGGLPAPEHVVRDRRSHVPPAPHREKPGTGASARILLVALRFYVLVFLCLIGGVVLIQRVFGRAERARPTKQPELALVPQDAARFRAVARPWADVFVDGQKVETTPFAQPLPLSPGVHYVRFEHPNAQPERRRIEASAGQNVFLDIEMKLNVSEPEAPAELLPQRGPDAGDDSP
jgi:eukaryotic-like serine/threonine-protein kinase